MADMIARLKVDSSEYDSKIQRAAKGIQHLAEACHNAGAHLNVLEDENREYIQSLGNMATVATTARGKIAELTSAFIDIKSVYNSLSQEEKNGEFGKELNKQLDIMKGRIQEGKRELADINNEINGGGGLTGALDSLAGKFGLNIKQLAGWGTALTVAKGALDVAKDAFFANEAQLDEWGRTVQTSQSLYEGFLNALNTGDISGYLSNIDNIITAARDAYDAMDTLATFNAFTRGSRAGLRSNYSEALNEYKLNPTATNKKTLDEANKALVDGLQQQADKIKDSYEKALNSLGVNRLLKGQQLQEFKNLFRAGKWDELESMKAGYSQGKLLNAGSQYWYGDRVYDGKIKDRFTDQWRVMSENEKKQFEFARVLSQVNDKQIDAVQALDEQYRNTLDAINNQNRSYNRLAGNNNKPSPQPTRRTGGGTTTVDYAPDSIMAQQAEVSRLTKLWQSAGATVRDDYKSQLEEAQYLLDRMTGKENFDPANMRELTDLRGTTAWATSEQLTQGAGLTLPVTLDIQSPEEKLREEVARLQELLTNAFTDAEREAYSKALKDKKGQLDNLTGSGGGNKSDVDGFKNFNDKFSQLNSGVGSIVSGIQQMGVEIPKELQSTLSVLQGISTIMTGILAIITVLDAKQTAQTAMSFVPFFAHGGLVHAATGYIVPGNDHADRTLIAASSGELILNRAQQGVIASQLESGNGGGMHVVGEIQGEKIVLVANRFLKRSGQGELVTWK